MPSRTTGKFLLGGAVIAGTAGAVVARALRPESQLFGRTLVAGNDPGELALTYDDGPNDRSTPALLDVLARFNARATFFMIGRFIKERPDVVRAVHKAGHLIGNHTCTHPFLANKSVTVIERELRCCNQALEDVLGAPIRYFRAPYGGRRPAVLRMARELGLEPVQWNAQGNDWEPIGVSGILRRLDRDLMRVQRQGRGANILLHDGFDAQMSFDRSDTVRATELILLRAQQQGKRVVTVDAWT
jgi:peptidoglycan/xylan/chitin deacetylase (PgdA/CDA1 family)